VEVELSEIILKAYKMGLKLPLTGPNKDAGSLILMSDEKTKAKNRVRLDIQPLGLPSFHSYLQCRFSDTYFLEIFKASGIKIYESEWYVDDVNKRFSCIEFTDS